MLEREAEILDCYHLHGTTCSLLEVLWAPQANKEGHEKLVAYKYYERRV